MTKQRLIILEELKDCHDHPNADMVYQKVRRKLPNISLGTVYRSLEMLAEIGLVRKIDVPGSRMRFDGNLAPHHHIRCLECGLVDDYPVRFEIDQMEESTAAGYQVMGYNIEFFGKCPECVEKIKLKY